MMTYRARTLVKVSAGLVLVGSLALFAYFGMYRQQKTARLDQMKAKLALDLEKEKVTKIEMVKGQTHTIVEKRSIDANQLPVWHMLEPVDAPADSITINSLLGVLERMDAEDRVEVSDADSLEKFGLSKPRVKWILFLEGGKKKELLIGNKTSFDNQIYSMVTGTSSVMLLKGYLEDSLIKSTFDLREKHLFRLDASRVKGLIIQKPGNSAKNQRIELARKDGKWKIVAPLTDRADDKEVQKILNALANLRAKAFPASHAGLGAYGLDPPSLKIFLVMIDDTQVDIDMGFGTLKSNKEMVFARIAKPLGPVAKISSYLFAVANKGVQDLIFRNLLDLDFSKVARIKIDGKEGLLVLERSQTDRGEGKKKEKSTEYTWSLVSPVAKPAKKYKVQAMLSSLAKLKATRLGPVANEKNLKSTGLDLPQKTVTLFDENGGVLGSLKIAPVGKDSTWVLGNARHNLCLVSSHNISTILLGMGELAEDR